MLFLFIAKFRLWQELFYYGIMFHLQYFLLFGSSKNTRVASKILEPTSTCTNKPLKHFSANVDASPQGYLIINLAKICALQRRCNWNKLLFRALGNPSLDPK